VTIYQTQCLLAYLGYSPGTIDGLTGKRTEAAIADFQANAGLTQDGIAGEATQAALLAAVAAGSFRPADTVTEAASSADGFWANVPHFSREEFRCQCGGKYCDGFPAEPAEALLMAAERVRVHFNAPVIVSSGVRCTTHNAAVGGVSNSRHLSGHAMDYCVQGHTAAEVLAYAQKQPEIAYAYAINDSYVHMDIGA